MITIPSHLCRAARSLGLVSVGVLSTLGALSLAHVGPAQAQSPGVNLAALVARLNADEAKIAALQTDNAALKAKTAPLSVSGTDLTVSGVNVHIVSGSGSTSDGTVDASGDPVSGKSLSGLGNLIIGYNAMGNDLGAGDVRTGSHNLVLGDQNNYTSFGGMVASSDNAISGRYASASGGTGNTASSYAASVSGGTGNTAGFDYASVSGGRSNRVSGYAASVGGGVGNKASDSYASVSGGGSNTASGVASSVSGGFTISQKTEDGWAAGSQANVTSSTVGNFRSP